MIAEPSRDAESTLRQLVAKVGETSADFSSSANLKDDLRIDSVRVFELVFEIERSFGVSFPEERFVEVASFADLLRVVGTLAP